MALGYNLTLFRSLFPPASGVSAEKDKLILQPLQNADLFLSGNVIRRVGVITAKWQLEIKVQLLDDNLLRLEVLTCGHTYIGREEGNSNHNCSC